MCVRDVWGWGRSSPRCGGGVWASGSVMILRRAGQGKHRKHRFRNYKAFRDKTKAAAAAVAHVPEPGMATAERGRAEVPDPSSGNCSAAEPQGSARVGRTSEGLKYPSGGGPCPPPIRQKQPPSSPPRVRCRG